MLKVVETFSGIGSQAKALKNIGIDYEIACTVDWDINAMIAYDLIHHGKQDLSVYRNMTKQDMIQYLSKYTLSLDGKKPATEKNIQDLNEDVLKRVLCSIRRSNNLVSITDIKAKDLPNTIDLLTYSFPCQDLSLAGNWHGNKGGIDRNAHNRSGMLWEVERILKERIIEKMQLPRFLLMENVSNILSDRHKDNFKEWTDFLEEIGYFNQIYTLDASKFGIPQKRVRTYMVSVLVEKDNDKRVKVENYFKEHNLEDDRYVRTLNIKERKLKECLRLDYNNEVYRMEANMCQPNDTPSRKDIYEHNTKIYYNKKIMAQTVPTVTTKQDRHPNSGVIDYWNEKEGKSKFRYLTPRECFLLMGFDEEDYDCIVNNNFEYRKKKFFNIEKLNRMAGNSIVVNVLEEIFKQIDYINNIIFMEELEVQFAQVSSIDRIKSKLARLFNAQNEAYQLIK